jgi:hypothetical protein
MKTETVQIVDRGRGPQLSSSRITVLDIFYYLHRGHDFEFIQVAMPTLSRDEFNVVVEYVTAHYDELVQKDQKADEFIRKGIEAQRARGGIFAEGDENLTTEQRVSRLMGIMKQRMPEKNGEGHPG